MRSVYESTSLLHYSLIYLITMCQCVGLTLTKAGHTELCANCISLKVKYYSELSWALFVFMDILVCMCVFLTCGLQ